MLIRFEKLNKSFGPVRVLTDLNLTLNKGEVLALMGENGAGKSTLMKVLSGVHPHGTYEGNLYFEDQLLMLSNPKDAERLGIAIIHQELSFFPHLTVAENLFVGRWPSQGGRVKWREIEQEAQAALDRVGASCSPQDVMKDLRVGEQQLVEIAKALYRKSKALILDEPTSALSPRESDRLFKLMRELRSEGVALVYISHKMDEIFSIADRIAVLRDGKIVGDAATDKWTRDELVKRMVGRELTSLFPVRSNRIQNDVVLSVRDLVFDCSCNFQIGPLGFDIRKGEILGLAGLLGAGRTELIKALFGDERYKIAGTVLLNGDGWSPEKPTDSLAKRIAYLSEDRKRESLLKKRSLEENLRISAVSLKNLFAPLKDTFERDATESSLKSLRVRYHAREQDILELSGGNQQKVVLGRCLEIAPDVILLDEPTRGVDIGAKFEIYQQLLDLAAQGKAILLASSEMSELMGLCDRILVMKRGQSMGILGRGEWSAEAIGSRAFGEVGT